MLEVKVLFCSCASFKRTFIRHKCNGVSRESVGDSDRSGLVVFTTAFHSVEVRY